MRAPLFTAADYVTRLQALLPRGRAWPRADDAIQTKVLNGLAQSTANSNSDANALLVGAFPATADALLTDWEAALGLPGPFGSLAGTTAGRRAAVVAALANTGGQSKAYFIALAASLGMTITITEFLPYSVSKPVNTPIAGDQWAHSWQVNASAAIAISYTPPASLDIVQATPGFGNPLLESLLSAFKPAQTLCITSYT